MDRRKLSQLKYLKNEIKIIQKQIDDIETRTTADSVRGSQVEFPYIEYNIKIEGIDMQQYNRKLRRLQRELNRRVEELMDLVEEIEEYLQTIDDCITRQAIMLKYINGLTWEQTAASIGGGNTGEGVKKRVQRFFQEN